jgi:hypothetical protein
VFQQTQDGTYDGAYAPSHSHSHSHDALAAQFRDDCGDVFQLDLADRFIADGRQDVVTQRATKP